MCNYINPVNLAPLTTWKSPKQSYYEKCIFVDFSKWPPVKFSKILNAYIFGTNALWKVKLVSKHMFLWSSSPINMFVKTYKDFDWQNPRWLHYMTTLYNWIRWQKYHHSIPILAWWWQVCDLHDSLKKYQIFTLWKSANHLDKCFSIYIYVYGRMKYTSGVGIPAIYSLNSRHQKYEHHSCIHVHGTQR